MRIPAGKISTIVLWVCMIITLGIFALFYVRYINSPEEMDVSETTWVLNWMFILFFIVILAVLGFSVYYFIKSGKSNPKKKLQPLIWPGIVGVLFLITYQFGSGEPLQILGYTGNENTFEWLKITDMWIYSLYILLGLAAIAVFSGIIWSYIKKK